MDVNKGWFLIDHCYFVINCVPSIDQLSLQDGHPRRFVLSDVRHVGEAGYALVFLETGLRDNEAAEPTVPGLPDGKI